MPKNNDFIEVDITDLACFMDEIIELLSKYHNGEFAENSESMGEEEQIKICHNSNSGNTFLSVGDYRVLMINGYEELEEWISCPECGEEGFKSDFEPNKIEYYYYKLHKHADEEEEFTYFKSEKREITVHGMIELAVKEKEIDHEEKLMVDSIKEITQEEYEEETLDYEDDENTLRCPNCKKKI